MNPKEKELEKENANLRMEIEFLSMKIKHLESQIDNKVQRKKPGRKPYDNVQVIMLIKNLYANDCTLGQIARYLNSKGIKPQKGKKWYRSTVSLMLKK